MNSLLLRPGSVRKVFGGIAFVSPAFSRFRLNVRCVAVFLHHGNGIELRVAVSRVISSATSEIVLGSSAEGIGQPHARGQLIRPERDGLALIATPVLLPRGDHPWRRRKKILPFATGECHFRALAPSR